MTLHIKFLVQADEDIKRLYTFLSDINISAAKKALQAIYADIVLLSLHPEIGRPLRRPLYVRERCVNFGARGYVIHYRATETDLIIIRIWHGSETRL
ncbi:type II toxin-antitoxin system RelE/ParE family toxin [Fretibacter rubidus]|uniref:type II toxin-antitoxin system RelE/ParE family toxin n=1 Tax=Fretibacter rubidus TaxID=570162 RepID=UPI00352B2046